MCARIVETSQRERIFERAFSTHDHFSAETLYEQAGILDRRAGSTDTVAAIRADAALSERHKAVLLPPLMRMTSHLILKMFGLVPR